MQKSVFVYHEGLPEWVKQSYVNREELDAGLSGNIISVDEAKSIPSIFCNTDFNNMFGVKTFEQWQASGEDLDLFLNLPCEIDEELANYMAEVIAPTYCANGIVQGGDPESSEKGEDGNDIFSYLTTLQIGDQYFYLGILPEFRQ
jgi:hypothetical protein